jgi:hypothetical protein
MNKPRKEERGATLEKLKYAEDVVDRVHAQTFKGELKWNCNSERILVEPTPNIWMRIDFEDEGPDSAIWKNVMIKHPVGKGVTILGNPDAPKTILFDPTPRGRMLDQVNEIFRHVLLDTRQRQFEDEMDRLHGL